MVDWASVGTFLGRWIVWRWLCAWWRRMTAAPIFYPDRATLERESPHADKFFKSEVIYAIWLTGSKSIIEIPQITRVTRLLLPDPESKTIEYFQSAMSGQGRSLSNEIRQSTRLAHSQNIEVRWLKEFLGYTLTIGNPKGQDTWVQIEIAIPVIHGSNHPSFEFRKPKHAKTINDVIEMFDKLWSSNALSRTPEPSEFENG